MLCQIILTPWESRRLIARAVVNLPEVRAALKEGIVCVARGTTSSYIVEEIAGPFQKERYCMGCIEPGRLCLVQEGTRLPEVSFIKGKMREVPSKDIVGEMGARDVFIKGANAVDPDFEAGILLGSPSGGTIGGVIGAVYAKGIQFIIPVGLEKLIPSVRRASRLAGLTRVSSAMGMPVGLFPVYGKVMTEIQALEQGTLTVMPIAAGGVNGAEGACVLSIEGEDHDVKRALELVNAVKGENPLVVPSGDCTTCDHVTCSLRKVSP